jgi:hypothetical protein
VKRNAARRAAYAANPERIRAIERDRYRANPLRKKAVDVKSKYGAAATLAYFAVTSCESCGDPIEGKVKHVDHDHATGAFRGILCAFCNVALGYLRESPTRIRALLKYARRHCKETG